MRHIHHFVAAGFLAAALAFGVSASRAASPPATEDSAAESVRIDQGSANAGDADNARSCPIGCVPIRWDRCRCLQ